MDKPKVLVADSISPKGVELLESGGRLLVDVKLGLKEDDLVAIAAEYSADRRSVADKDHGKRNRRGETVESRRAGWSGS